MPVKTYHDAIFSIANGDIILSNTAARAFEAVLTNTAFVATDTFLSAIVTAGNSANVPLVNISFDKTTSAGNSIWKTGTADYLTWTLTGMSNANAVVFYASTGAAAAATKLIGHYTLSTWFNGVANDTLTLYTNGGIIRFDDPNT